MKLFLLIGLIFLFLAIYRSEDSPSPTIPLTTTAPTVTATPIPTNIPTKVPTIKPSPTVKPTYEPVDWQSLTISEDELITGINRYRKSQGVSDLAVNEGLCKEARKRAQDLTNQNMGRWPFTLGHEPFLQDVEDGTLGKLSGLTFFGENVASSNCKKLTDGSDVFVHDVTQLVEECFASSAGHKENLLKPDWTNICSSGRYPFYVQIFGK